MSVAGIMRTALWTEILEALRADYPDVVFDNTAGKAMSRVVSSNADFILELADKSKEGK